MLDNRITARILQRCLGRGEPTARLRKSWEDAMRLDDVIFLNMTNERPVARHRSDWSEKTGEVMGSKRAEEPWEEDSDIVMTNQ
jgi:hypothetical protein